MLLIPEQITGRPTHHKSKSSRMILKSCLCTMESELHVHCFSIGPTTKSQNLTCKLVEKWLTKDSLLHCKFILFLIKRAQNKSIDNSLL